MFNRNLHMPLKGVLEISCFKNFEKFPRQTASMMKMFSGGIEIKHWVKWDSTRTLRKNFPKSLSLFFTKVILKSKCSAIIRETFGHLFPVNFK